MNNKTTETSKFKHQKQVKADTAEEVGKNQTFIAGRLKSYNNEWQKVTSDPTILQAIEGYKLEFESGTVPVQDRLPRPYKLADEEARKVDEGINKLMIKGVIS